MISLKICALAMFIFPILALGEEFYIPPSFIEGQTIEQIIFILDVDGVVRDNVNAIADPRVIEAVKTLLKSKNVDVTFISGTPIESNGASDPSRQSNVPLNKVFGSSFENELSGNRVAIFGVLGGHRMMKDGSLEVVDQYSMEISYELEKLLILAFLNEVLENGSVEQKPLADQLKLELENLELNHIVTQIREHLDPHFKLINNGALIETHTSSPSWNTSLSAKWLKEEMENPHYLVSTLPNSQKQLATGLAKKGDQGFNYLLISKTNKGLTTKKHIEEKMQLFPRSLIVTLGDTQVDFPMHENAHLAFHVGLEQVWINNPLPQCVMIRDSEGKDSQHVEGTLKVIQLLNDGIGKPFYDLKYIPKQASTGEWNYYSINEILIRK